MPFITREDGEHFIIPSYRDVITAKQTSAVKKEVLALSQSYGEYITIQTKAKLQYEVAFSPDQGYLLGETVWYKFNRPTDMIYCEAVPNSTEAILVIVKNGSVYLDGSFQIDSIPEELIIFLTQQNNFEIYIYGNVPIGATAGEGKFSFDEGSVKSFTVLEEPVFNNLPLIKAYRFQSVDAALKSQGIGALPIKAIAGALGVLILGYYVVANYFMEEEKKPQELPMEQNPYEGLVNALNSPVPSDIIKAYVKEVNLMLSAPGWIPVNLIFKGTTFESVMFTQYGTFATIYTWANTNKLNMLIKGKGIFITDKGTFPARPKPKKVYPLKDVLVLLVDRLMVVYPGYGNLSVGDPKPTGPFKTSKITIRFRTTSPQLLLTVAQALDGLPLVLENMTFGIQSGGLSGAIQLSAFGN